MSKHRLALVDGDILCYEFGSPLAGTMASDNKKPSLANNFFLLDQRINKILDKSKCSKYEIYLTDSPSNFRIKVATIKPYKGNRKNNEKPPYWKRVREHLCFKYGAEIIRGYEADDALAMEQDEDTVICTRDKDLDQVPGWHYRWSCGGTGEKNLFYITELEGAYSFYMQLMIGDPADNIPGLYGYGRRSAKKRLEECKTELDMYNSVKELYEQRFGSYWNLFLTENATLLYLLRSEGDKWVPPT